MRSRSATVRRRSGRRRDRTVSSHHSATSPAGMPVTAHRRDVAVTADFDHALSQPDVTAAPDWPAITTSSARCCQRCRPARPAARFGRSSPVGDRTRLSPCRRRSSLPTAGRSTVSWRRFQRRPRSRRGRPAAPAMVRRGGERHSRSPPITTPSWRIAIAVRAAANRDAGVGAVGANRRRRQPTTCGCSTVRAPIHASAPTATNARHASVGIGRIDRCAR